MYIRLKILIIFLIFLLVVCDISAIESKNLPADGRSDSIFCTHKVVLDKQNKILSWYIPQNKAYDHFLHLRWNFVKNKVPNSPGPIPRSLYPQYYFYCAFKVKNEVLEPDNWMNDIGEKIPNWFESARLFYAYTGDTVVMNIVKDFIDYTLEHGTCPSTFAWPNFPYLSLIHISEP